MNRRNFMCATAAIPLLACGNAGTNMPKQTAASRDDTGLNYVIEGEGPNLILLHGASGNHRDWTFKIFGELTKSYRVMAFDRPGLGQSPAATEPTLAAQADMMREAALANGLAKATLVGHSFGGSVALQWALRHPDQVSGLALVSAPSQVWPGSAGGYYDIANTPLIGYGLSLLVPVLASDRVVRGAIASIYEPQAIPDGYADHVTRPVATSARIFRNNAAQVGLLKEQIREMVPRYPELTMPIELIHGTADTIVPAKVHSIPFARQMPNARLTLLDGVGHMPHQTNSDTLLQAIGRIAR